MAKESADYRISSSDEAGPTVVSTGGGDDVYTSAGAISFDTDDLDKGAPEDADLDADEADVAGDAGSDADGDGDAEGGDDEAPAELPDFDGEDPEVVEAYNARYVTAEGNLDVEGALSAEFFANAEKGVEGLNESTYAYLQSIGISRATVKQVEAMAATAREGEKLKADTTASAHDARLFEVAGGPEELSKALAWGKSGGYTKEQQDRFNAATKGKDLAAKEEAVEALMARYRRANPPERPTLPRRDATKGQGKPLGGGPKPFASRQEARKFRSDLADTDTKGWATYKARLGVTKFQD